MKRPVHQVKWHDGGSHGSTYEMFRKCWRSHSPAEELGETFTSGGSVRMCQTDGTEWVKTWGGECIMHNMNCWLWQQEIKPKGLPAPDCKWPSSSCKKETGLFPKDSRSCSWVDVGFKMISYSLIQQICTKHLLCAGPMYRYIYGLNISHSFYYKIRKI